MARIEVDVDIEQFETEEIVSELIHRIQPNRFKALKENQKKKLRSAISELRDELAVDIPEAAIEIRTLDDRMKYDHLVNVFSKYTIAQMQEALP